MTRWPVRRRGSMYVTVLLTAVLVALISVSGLLAARVQLQSSGTLTDVVAARFYAESAIELALLAIRTDPNWRSTLTNDNWTAAQPIGGGTYRWKVVDEEDGDLQTNPSGAVRLYGAGMTGTAVRTCSVLIHVEDGKTAHNLLENPGLEGGLTGWTGLGQCDLEIDTKEPHGGDACMLVKDRDDEATSGPHQDIKDKISSGVTYQMAAWVRVKDFGEIVWLRVWMRTDWGWQCIDAGAAWVEGEWVQVTGSFTPVWSGPLHKAWWKLETQWSEQDFWVDDAVLVEDSAASDTEIIPMPGTWRRDIVVP